jgi:integrase
MLSQEVEHYIRLRQAAGFIFYSQSLVLRQFVRFAEAAGDDRIRTARVFEWVTRRTAPVSSRTELHIIRAFALAALAETPGHEVPPAKAVGAARGGRPTPFIWRPDEIARLVEAARLASRSPVRSQMYALFFGLVAATGLRLSEALHLKIGDITGEGLIVRTGKSGRSRMVVLHPTVRTVLTAWLEVRLKRSTVSDDLFVSRRGVAPSTSAVRMEFHKLLRAIGLEAAPGGKTPRIHDLRHSFAVRSLEECGGDRATLSRHMTALSTYLGHAHLASTYWYLQATPALLTGIAAAHEDFHARHRAVQDGQGGDA